MTRIENVLLRWKWQGHAAVHWGVGGSHPRHLCRCLAPALDLVLYFIATVIFTALVIQWTNAVRQRYIRGLPCPLSAAQAARDLSPPEHRDLSWSNAACASSS